MLNIVFQKAWKKQNWVKLFSSKSRSWILSSRNTAECSLSYGPDTLRIEKYHYSPEIP